MAAATTSSSTLALQPAKNNRPSIPIGLVGIPLLRSGRPFVRGGRVILGPVKFRRNLKACPVRNRT